MAIEVKLEAFEGPLDLLLHLIEKNKVDISQKDTKKYILSPSIRTNVRQNTKNNIKINYDPSYIKHTG